MSQGPRRSLRGNVMESKLAWASMEVLVDQEVKIGVISNSLCRAFTQRQEVGRVKHFDAKYLWFQQEIEKELGMSRISTALNISDLGALPLAWSTMTWTRRSSCWLVRLNLTSTSTERHGQET